MRLELDRNAVIIFGAGGMLREYITILEDIFQILYLVDNDSAKWGMRIATKGNEYPIYPPDILRDNNDMQVWVCSNYWQTIVSQLIKIGIKDVHAIRSTVPLESDYNHCKVLYEYIWNHFKHLMGNRNDFDWIQMAMHIYADWNDHYKPSPFLMNYNKNRKILDYGFGVGTLLLNGLIQGYDMHGVEVAQSKYDFVKQKIDELRYPDNWKNRFILYDGIKLPYENEEFDIVIALMVLEHVQDIEASLSEMLRVCRHGGALRITFPNYDLSLEPHYYIDVNGSLKENQDKLEKAICKYNMNKDVIGKLNFINEHDIRSLLDKMGVKQIKNQIRIKPNPTIDLEVIKY